jgi:two-component system, response regulator PdtaR
MKTPARDIYERLTTYRVFSINKTKTRETDVGPPILVVEDDPFVAGYICDLLSILGFQVLGSASCGVEAIILAEQSRPALAVIDVSITGPLDGIDVAQALHDRFAVTPIFLSGCWSETSRANACDVPLAECLAKPFRPTEMLQAIERALL